MTETAPRRLRQAVRSELALGSGKPGEAAPRWMRRVPAAMLRVTALAAVLSGLGGALSAQAPYRQELIPGFSSLDVGRYCDPDLADLDGDGDLDAVVGSYSGFLRYFANTGTSANPSFVERTGSGNPFPGVFFGVSSSPDLVDLDGDGDLDAVYGVYFGTLRYFANTGSSASPAFVQATGTANPFTGIDVGYYSIPALVDLDGDGDLDAALGESGGTLRYFANTGSSASPAFVEATGGGNPWSGVDVGDDSNPDLVDLDDDGDLDAVVGESGGTLRYFANTGSSASPAFVEATGSGNPFSGVDVGYRSGPDLVDFDGDGDLDALVGERDGTLRYFANSGTSASPAFVAGVGSGNAFTGVDAGYISSPDLVDLDGDGDLDAVVGESDGTLNYFANTGNAVSPVFVEGTGSGNPLSGVDVGLRSSPELADLDGDGDLDAVVGSYPGTLLYFANTGTSASPVFVEGTGGGNPFSGVDVGLLSSPDLADLDGDGDLDAVVGESDGSLNYFANTGSSVSPAFVEGTGTGNPFNGIDVGQYSTPDLVDLDGDGDLDTVVGERFGVLKYVVNTGSSASPAFVAATGTANPFNLFDIGRYISPVLADLDDDGDVDALVGDRGGHVVFLRSRVVESVFDAGFSDGFEGGDLTAWSNF